MDSISLHQKNKFNCKNCSALLLEVETFDQPLKPNNEGISMSLFCTRCKNISQITIVNGENDEFIKIV